MSTVKVAISFDETKPHWAIRQGLDKAAERLGMRDVSVGGDFDAKIAVIYGTVDDFEGFAEALGKSGLSEGSLYRVRA